MLILREDQRGIKHGEEVGERGVDFPSAVVAAAEKKTEVGAVYAVVEVLGDKARYCGAGGLSGGERFPDAIRVGLEDLGENMAVVGALVGFVVLEDEVRLGRGLDHGADLVDGVSASVEFPGKNKHSGWKVMRWGKEGDMELESGRGNYLKGH